MALMSFWLVLALFLDQLTKKIIIEYIQPYETIDVLGKFLRITNVKNTGISFGMFQGFTHILVPLVFVIIIIVFFIALKFIKKSPWLAFSFGAIIGGALGNQIDRLFKGAVIDFISVDSFAVFNVSDSFVVVGAIVLGIHTLFYSEHFTAINWTDGLSIKDGIRSRIENGFFRNTKKIKTIQNQFLFWIGESIEGNKLIVEKKDRIYSLNSVIESNINQDMFLNQESTKPVVIIQNFSGDFANSTEEIENRIMKQAENGTDLNPIEFDAESFFIVLNKMSMRSRYVICPESDDRLFSSKGNMEKVMRIIIVNNIKKNINVERSQELMNNDFILEILIEEIPPSEIKSLEKQMNEGIANLLEQSRIKHDGVEFFYAARRFGISVKNISERQEDGEEIKRGPAKKIAFDDENNPSKALAGFLRGNKANVEDVIIKEENGVEYCYLQRKIVGKATAEVLEKKIPEFLNKLNFKKPMKWADGQYKFVRPVHNVLAVLGSHIVEFEFMGKKSTNMTEAHRFLSFEENTGNTDNRFVVEKADVYFQLLREKYVYSNQKERKAKILEDIKLLENEMAVSVPLDEELVNEVTSLTENPTPVVGEFDRKYLELPKEVLITTLKHHQRTFPIVKQKTLMNNFLSFKDNVDLTGKAATNVKKGYRKVIEARLEDAFFYYKDDMKTSFSARTEQLEKIGFQNKLGSMAEKVERNKELALQISALLELTEESKNLVTKAALLMKNDLTTHMVYEFPELQGIMGRVYSKLEGESFEVSQAIEEQYSDLVPETYVGCIITLADNLDTIAGNLLINNIPSGSKDPFALRRALTKILTILFERDWDFDLLNLFKGAIENYNFKLDENQIEALTGIFSDLLKNRIDYMLNESGIEYDVINATTHLNNRPLRSFLAAKALMTVKTDEKFFELAKLFERVHNISKKHRSCEYDARLFEHEEEKLLETEFAAAKEIAIKKLNAYDYKGSLECIKELTNTINQYFDNVFVMCDREDLKLTRLGFLKTLDSFFMQMGNLSEIVIVSREN